MVFFGTLAFIAVAISLPLAAMYAAGQFVGQKPPPAFLKLAVTLAVGAGLLMAVAGALLSARQGGMSLRDWFLLAWVAGSALTGQVALLELLGSKPARDLPPPNT
ncbi:hypothetical protein [Mesorhizobium sp. M0478]|uniref:hypothetical protein n=1 Tax=Mesorhizobium sp. M0478 TaxID=2956947 RepID=UPI0033388DA5